MVISKTQRVYISNLNFELIFEIRNKINIILPTKSKQLSFYKIIDEFNQSIINKHPTVAQCLSNILSSEKWTSPRSKPRDSAQEMYLHLGYSSKDGDNGNLWSGPEYDCDIIRNRKWKK